MLPIETGDENPILRKVCSPVEGFDVKLEKLIQEMEETMLEEDPKTGVKGVGLAANQVGINQRVLLLTLNVNTRKDHRVVAMVNPEILEASKNEVKMDEGCLSVPGVFAPVRRAVRVHVRWQNVCGEFCERKFEKWDARIFLHELDHLNGILFTDYLPEKSSKTPENTVPSARETTL